MIKTAVKLAPETGSMPCDHTNSRWVTRQLKGRMVDLRICSDCDRPLTLSRFVLPLKVLQPGHCANCGAPQAERMLVAAARPGERIDLSPRCQSCNLSRREDRRLHLALAQKLGCDTLSDAATTASEVGRHTLALKLATASFHYEDDPLLVRSIRLQTLEAMGQTQLAEEEGRDWLSDEEAPAFVGGLVGDIFLRHGKPEDALAMIQVGLDRDPEDRFLRLEKAEVLEDLDRPQEAVREAQQCMDATDDITHRATDLLERCVERLFTDEEWTQIRSVFRAAAPFSHRSPQLCYMQACAELARDRLSEARRWLLRTLQLDPQAEEAASALEQLEARMGLAHTPVTRR